MLKILVCHELMLAGRLTRGYDAELYRVISIAGCRGYQKKQNTTKRGDNEAGRSNWGGSEIAIEELTISRKHEAHEQRGVTSQSLRLQGWIGSRPLSPRTLARLGRQMVGGLGHDLAFSFCSLQPSLEPQ